MILSIFCNDLNMPIKPISVKIVIKSILLAVPYVRSKKGLKAYTLV